MSYEIVDRYTKAVLYRSETAPDVRSAVVEAVSKAADLVGADLGGANLGGAYLGGAYLGGANLEGANLVGANLVGADLGGAYLRGAYLGYAYLGGADLGYANLREADLVGAYLRGADLGGANLEDANLRGADLVGAKFDDKTVMPYGETWREYLEHVVPQLLIAGGKPLAAVACEEHWKCNSWENCPMAAAFDVHSESDTPLLLRPRVREFVQLFDAGLIPMPKTEEQSK